MLVCGLFFALALGAFAAKPAAKARAPKSLHTMSWGDKLKEAGVVGAVQLGMSACRAIFIFERLFGLRRKNLAPSGLSARTRKRWAEGKFADLEKRQRD